MERSFPLSIQEVMQDLKAIEQHGWDSSELVALVDPDRKASPGRVQSDLPTSLKAFIEQHTNREQVEHLLKEHSDEGKGLDLSVKAAQLFVTLVDQLLPNTEAQLRETWQKNHEMIGTIAVNLEKLNTRAPSAHVHLAPTHDRQKELEDLESVLPLEATAEFTEPPNVPPPDLEAVAEPPQPAVDGWDLGDEGADSLL